MVYRCWLNLALLGLLMLSGCQGEPTSTPIVISEPPATVSAATATHRPSTATPTAMPEPDIAPTPSPIPSPPTPAPAPTAVPTAPAVQEVEAASPTATPVPPVEGVVDWRDAPLYYGQQVTIGGTIIVAEDKGNVIYLNFSRDYKRDFKVVIFPDDAAGFPGPPEEMYRGRTVRVTGEITEYRGAPQIIVRQPSQIEIIGGEAEPPTATPLLLLEGVVDWRDAALYYGQQVTVEGTIVRTKNTGKVTFLNFDPDYRHTLTLVIFPDDAAKFPSPPEEMFLHRRLRATGLVQEYEGAPEIIVREPSQIEIIE